MRSLLFALFLLPFAATAQPIQPGDIAIVGLYHDAPDAFAFVTLTDLPRHTEIRFTENGWRAAGGFRESSEGTMVWTATETLPAGTVVTFLCANDQPESPATPSAGSIASGSICGLAAGGDQIIAYQTEPQPVTPLFAVNNSGTGWQADATNSNSSALPAGLVDGVTAIALPHLDNYAYTGPTAGSADELRAAIGNPANWTGSDDLATAAAFPTAFNLSGEPQPLTAYFATTTLDLREDAGAVRLRARLSEPAPEQVTVQVTTGGGTATAGTDFTFSPTTFTFEAGSDTASVQLVVIDDDEVEGDETITFHLRNPSRGIATGTLTLTIRDDDRTDEGGGDGVSYELLFPGTTGAALLDSLRRVYTPSTLGYNGARDRMFGYVWNDDGRVEGLYTGLTINIPRNAGDARSRATAQDFNTEHAWPQSQGAGSEPQRSNLFNLFPTQIGVNSDRGNLPFGEVDDAQATDWYRLSVKQRSIPTSNRDEWSERGQGRFEPRERFKGDVARSQFYFYAIYQRVSSEAFFNTMKHDLLAWHRADTVSAEERLRHDRIVEVQGKANPFVLDSTLVRRAFFSGSTGDPGNPGDPPTGTVLTMAQARQRGSGAVTVRGLVTRSMGAYTYFQDDTGGLVVRQTMGSFYDLVQSGGIAPGDSLHVEGVLSTFNGLLQINAADLQRFSILNRGNALPAPVTLTPAQFAAEGERYESTLIRVEGLRFSDTGSFAATRTYTATVNGSTVDVRIGNANDTAVDGLPIPQQATFIGVLGQFTTGAANSGYQLMPVEASDLATIPTSTDDAALPTQFAVQGVHPNPASHTATIRLSLPQAAGVRVEVYDVTGRAVRSFEREMPAGAGGALSFDASDLPAGLYLYRVTAALPEGATSATGRLVVMR